MKSLIELVKEGRERQVTYDDLEERLEAVAHDATKVCIDELEAWGREVDKCLESFSNDIGELYVARIRQKLLGTTRPISKNGE